MNDAFYDLIWGQIKEIRIKRQTQIPWIESAEEPNQTNKSMMAITVERQIQKKFQFRTAD